MNDSKSGRRAPKPSTAKEPNCVHPGGEHQPASACRICKDGPQLREWSDGWAAWLAENPDSYEAKAARERDMTSDGSRTVGAFHSWR